ncbi:hypothetical protein A2703_03260 [Candidatus Collierbacteria bacterium RIFCSPHIGHO2_01_FULL_50_25]|uniref:Uncharacterized protein n=1 Tax=Candidatus Collierbacteria bacterium RIFCSPHIGHO2_01_FULL_50_25 TaxID=1817722 RepID=A0A1F5EWP7_9BACT|nr:MAG: hypothetical protein A2703_03260 [Candidatus Collierbacteria bacterium RIFCSPHIGHO2_01_FULL_50_25]
MKEKDILAAIEVIGEDETRALLRDEVWGEPIIKAGVACAKKEEYFTLGADYTDFEEMDPAIRALFSRAAELGVYDLALFEAGTGLLVGLLHWYMPPARPDEDPDPEYQGEVILVEVSPQIIFLGPTVDPEETGRKPELVVEFANLVGCVPKKADLLETLTDKEEKSPTVEVYLWRR